MIHKRQTHEKEWRQRDVSCSHSFVIFEGNVQQTLDDVLWRLLNVLLWSNRPVLLSMTLVMQSRDFPPEILMPHLSSFEASLVSSFKRLEVVVSDLESPSRLFPFFQSLDVLFLVCVYISVPKVDLSFTVLYWFHCQDKDIKHSVLNSLLSFLWTSLAADV